MSETTQVHEPEVGAEGVTISMTQIPKGVWLRLAGKGPICGEAVLESKFVP